MEEKTIRIPIELKPNYLRDPENFLRDIACVSLDSIRPFLKLRDKIIEVEKKAGENPFDDNTRFFNDKWFAQEGDYNRRYMHIDLGLKKDAVGISMCHSPYFIDREISQIWAEGLQTDVVRSPFVQFDFLGRIKADQGEEILLSSIRELIYEISRRGFYIALITFDGFQSADSIQILKSQGYKVGRQSIDRASSKLLLDKYTEGGVVRKSTDGQVLGPMQSLKDVLYDDRLGIVYHEYWEKEAKAAEIDYKKNKVDHPPGGTLDLLQSMAGSIYNLVNNEFEYIESGDTDETIGDDFYSDFVDNRNYMYDYGDES